MKTLMKAALLAAPFMGGSLAHASCQNAGVLDLPVIPDGAYASAEQMEMAQVEVETFVAAGEAYLKCYRPPNPYYNHVVDKIQTTATAYNTELREFISVKNEALAVK